MEITKEKKAFYNLLKISSEKLDSTLAPNLKAEFVLLNKNGEKNILVDFHIENHQMINFILLWKNHSGHGGLTTLLISIASMNF